MASNKQCKKCGEVKAETPDFFYRVKSCVGGLDTVCRQCRNAQRNDWKKKNRERVNARRRQLYKEKYGDRHKALEVKRAEQYPIRTKAERLLSGIRERCKALSLERGPEFQTKAWLVEKLTSQTHCECCGVQFTLSKGEGAPVDTAASVDRFDPQIGYVVSNVRLICWRCNNIKRNYNSADLRLVADWMDRVNASRPVKAWGSDQGKFDHG